jgi:pyruvate dehydrogenase E2 component (dihydrolipoamide acetyltransferase)
MSNRHEVRVPDLGEYSDVEIVEVMVAVGDHVSIEDPLITLETDKAAMEVPSTGEGKIIELPVASGMRLSEGDLIVVLELVAAAETATPAASTEPVISETDEKTVQIDPLVAATAPPVESVGPVEFTVPDLGDFPEAEIIEVHAQPGQKIALEDPVITLETDKAAMEVPSTVAGTVVSVVVEVGQSVGQGALIMIVDADAAVAVQSSTPVAATDAAPTAAAKPSSAPSAPPAAAPTRLPPINEQTFGKAHASPSVRKFARELGVNLGDVKSAGPKGRVLKEDVKTFVKSIMSGAVGVAGGGSALPKVPEVDFAKFGEIEVKPLTRIQKISGPRLHASWVNIPHVTQNDEADLTELEARRQKLKGGAKEQGVSLTPLAFILKAAVISLKKFPVFNTSLSPDGKSLVHKNYFHMGFAADTPNGLMVPVIRDVDQKDILSIAAELGELSQLARDGKLTAQQMQGGTFTVSSLGGIGGTTFTPIINAPEVAILGVGRAQMKPVYQDGEFVPRLILPVSLSYDHRVIDGATGVRFTTHLGQVLADVDRLLLGS